MYQLYVLICITGAWKNFAVYYINVDITCKYLVTDVFDCIDKEKNFCHIYCQFSRKDFGVKHKEKLSVDYQFFSVKVRLEFLQLTKQLWFHQAA